MRTWTGSFYMQHEWRPRANVSVNAGLRYDYQTPFHEANDLVSNFNAATRQLVISPTSLYEADAGNFGPRAGVGFGVITVLIAIAIFTA